MAMDPMNVVSGSLSEKDQKEVLNHIEAIQKKLNFLVALSADERKRLAKPSAEGWASCEALVEALQGYSKLFAADALDLKELQSDIDIVHMLTPICASLQKLLDSIESTLMAAKSDAYRVSLQAYGMAKFMKGQHPGLAAAIEPLKNALERPARSKKEEPQNG